MSGLANAETRREMGAVVPRLNRLATNEAYLKRLRKLPRAAFNSLEGAYLTSMRLRSTVLPTTTVSNLLMLECPVFQLFKYALSIGVDVRGVTSERSSKGVYLTPERRSDHNTFCFVEGLPPTAPTASTTRRRRLAMYPFALHPDDEVWYRPGEQTSLDTFHHHV